ncbi:MAG: type II toxin-antitoxin system Phd/YefM family antitoxin [Lachnospiraceae bacterium]|nr:type II toxin-antitoxin system Phd/YefM family antitoxin [Lachnospiraceae bacterium]
MIAARAVDVRSNMKDYMDIAYNGEPVIVSRRQNRNVVIVSEQEYNDLQKAKRNAEYLTKLDRSFEQLERGEVVVKSFEELERMADE